MLAGIAAFAVLVQTMLGALCPHDGTPGRIATAFDPLLGWITVCQPSKTAAVTDPARMPAGHTDSANDCCQNCTMPPPLASAPPAATVAVAWRTSAAPAPHPALPGNATTDLQYDGRGSRAPPMSRA